MNEELQSTNEELETINDELRSRTDDLNQVNSFLESILSSLKSAVIVLDSDMGVLVWSKQTEDLWGLRSDEVQGKHLLNLDIGLSLDKLHASIRNCLADREEENSSLELEAVNRRGRSIRCRIDISALRDLSGDITGAIVLTDVVSEGGADTKES
jgi:two-component system, chemotaxis family, CheB/CheR fusion protein